MPIGAMSDADFLTLLNAVIATISAELASYPGVTVCDDDGTWEFEGRYGG